MSVSVVTNAVVIGVSAAVAVVVITVVDVVVVFVVAAVVVIIVVVVVDIVFPRDIFLNGFHTKSVGHKISANSFNIVRGGVKSHLMEPLNEPEKHSKIQFLFFLLLSLSLSLSLTHTHTHMLTLTYTQTLVHTLTHTHILTHTHTLVIVAATVAPSTLPFVSFPNGCTIEQKDK